MKAQELRLLTDAAKAKYAKERPHILRDDLIQRMESQAKSGLYILDFCFSDSQEIVNQNKKTLAFQLTKIVHGEQAAQQVLEQAEALFEEQDSSSLPSVLITEEQVLDILVRVGFAKSRTDGRNLISNRGITINDEVLTDPTITLTQSQFGESLVLRKGKKNFCRLQFIQKDTNESP